MSVNKRTGQESQVSKRFARSTARRKTVEPDLQIGFRTNFIEETARDEEVVRVLTEDFAAASVESRLIRWFLNFKKESSARSAMAELSLSQDTRRESQVPAVHRSRCNQHRWAGSRQSAVRRTWV